MLPKLVGVFAVALTTFATFVVSADVADESDSAKAAISAADVKFFADQVRPILQAKCLKCHSGDQPKGKLHLTTRQAKSFADYLRKYGGENSEDQVELALRRALQRNPTQNEIVRGIDLLDSLCREYKVDCNQALDYYCLVVLNLSELIYLD